MAVSISSIVAPARPFELPTPRGLFWYARKKCWSSKIGYHISAVKKRVRSQQYYQSQYTQQGLNWAEKHFHARQVAWDEIVQKTDRDNAERNVLFPGSGKAKPIWPEKSEGRKEAQQVAVAIPMKVIGEAPKFSDPTLNEAKDRQFAALLHRTTLVGPQHLKPASYNTEKQTLRLALAPHDKDKSGRKPIDCDLLLSRLQLSHLRDFYSYWHSADLDLSRRTRKNYCLSFWKLLNSLANDDAFDFTVPKGAAALFKFGGDTANIATYDPESLKLIRTKSSDLTWTYCLLALNCGQYQDDISQIQVGTSVIQLDPKADKKRPKIGEIVRLENGKPIPLSRKELKQYDGSYDIYVSRIRNRTAHKYPYPALHWLFPETAKFLSRFVADDNQWDYALLGQTGLPLARKEADLPPYMAITKAYEKVMRKIAKKKGTPISFKQFRKIGVTAMGQIGGDTAVRLYRSQPPLGDAAMYQLDDYELKLTPHLKAWREKLKADGVL